MQSGVGSVTCDPRTLRLPRAPGPLGFGDSRRLPLPGGMGPGAQTTPPRLPSLYGPSPGGTGWAAPPSLSWGRASVGFSDWGKGRGPEMASWSSVGSLVCQSVCLLLGWRLCAPPSDPPSRPLSPLPRLFPTSCFLPGSGATEGCLEWGRCWGPPGGRRALPLPPPLPSDSPQSLKKKKFGQSCELGGCPGVRFPQVSSLPTSVGPRCSFWDPSVPALPVCLLPLFHFVSQCPERLSVSDAVSLPLLSSPCSRGTTLSSFLGAGLVVP